MKKDVMITIKGTQTVSGESDQMELTTVGEMYDKNGSIYLKYKESQSTGYEGCTTVVKVDGSNKVSMTRFGGTRSVLTMEKGVRHLCHYGTEHGDFMIGVFTQSVENNLTDNGGDITFEYSLDINTSLASENKVEINVTRQ